MPAFTFTGKSASGEKVSGERVAANKDVLLQQLRRERITPGSVREKGKEFSLPTFGSGKVGHQGHRHLLPAIFGHDRCRVAAGAVS